MNILAFSAKDRQDLWRRRKLVVRWEPLAPFPSTSPKDGRQEGPPARGKTIEAVLRVCIDNVRSCHFRRLARFPYRMRLRFRFGLCSRNFERRSLLRRLHQRSSVPSFSQSTPPQRCLTLRVHKERAINSPKTIDSLHLETQTIDIYRLSDSSAQNECRVQ
jgi:hypothetical protein